jgi:hypothetical protein
MELHAEVRRGIKCEGPRWASASSEAKHLLEWMLHSGTTQRATVKDIINHDFITKNAPRFAEVSAQLEGEILQGDQAEADEWSFIGAQASEWMFVDDEDGLGNVAASSSSAVPTGSPTSPNGGGNSFNNGRGKRADSVTL